MRAQSAADELAEVESFDEGQHEEGDPVVLADVVEGDDGWVAQEAGDVRLGPKGLDVGTTGGEVRVRRLDAEQGPCGC